MDPDLKQKIEILEHVRFEIRSFFLEPESAQKGRDLDESIKFRRMAHCRILREFFTKKKRKNDTVDRKGRTRVDDDVLASDFDFPGCCERGDLFHRNGDAYKIEECFNKRLFHLTYRRLEVSDEKWCIEMAFAPVETKAKEFVKHILGMLSNGKLRSPSVSPEILAKELEEWKKLEMDIGTPVRPPLQANTSNVASDLTPKVLVAGF